MAKRRTKNRKSLTRAALAKGLGISPRMVHKLRNRGMPVHSLEAAQEWRRVNLEPKREAPKVASPMTQETTRLKSAQAELAELEAAERRGDLMPVADAQQVASEAIVIVTTQLDGLPGRTAGQLAGMTDPAAIRKFLLDETRRIRAAMAEAFRKLTPPDGGTGGAAA